MPGTKTFHYYNALSNRGLITEQVQACRSILKLMWGLSRRCTATNHQATDDGGLQRGGSVDPAITSEELQSNEQAKLRIDSADGEIRSVSVRLRGKLCHR